MDPEHAQGDPPHTSNPFNQLPEPLVIKLLECLVPFWRRRARLACARLRSAADKLVKRVVTSPDDNYPFAALAALPARFPAATELELRPKGDEQALDDLLEAGTTLEQLLLPHLQGLPNSALRQITRVTGRQLGVTPPLLAQLGRACPMLREIQLGVRRLATSGKAEAGDTEADGTESGGTEAGEEGEAPEQLAAAASQNGAACDASPYLASLEALIFFPFATEPASAAQLEANAAALARLASLRRLGFGGCSLAALLGPPALASAALTALELHFCSDLHLAPLYNLPALRELAVLGVARPVEVLRGTWQDPLAALTKLRLTSRCGARPYENTACSAGLCFASTRVAFLCVRQAAAPGTLWPVSVWPAARSPAMHGCLPCWRHPSPLRPPPPTAHSYLNPALALHPATLPPPHRPAGGLMRPTLWCSPTTTHTSPPRRARRLRICTWRGSPWRAPGRARCCRS